MKPIVSSGKRKTAVARAVLTDGTGRITINGKTLIAIQSDFIRLKAAEPLTIAGDIVRHVTIAVRVRGGGPTSQADAVRLAIAKGIVAFTKDKKVEKTFLDYDRTLLVADVRRKETRKPNAHGKARAKVQKSYR